MSGAIPLGWIRQPDGSYSPPKKVSIDTKTYAPMDLKAIIKPITDESKLNKLEKSFLDVLRSRNYAWIGIQAITLKLGHDTRYTPDFFVLTQVGCLIAFETKGFFRDDAKVKLNVAARTFPFIDFWLVTKEKGLWKEILVRP